MPTTIRERRHEPRLADARLAVDQHHPSFAALRLLPAAQQQLDFLLAPNERRLPRAQRLEPAQHPALAEHPPRRLPLGEARQRLRAEIGKIEQSADLPARRIGDDQRVRRGQGLQPGGEVGCLANHSLFLRRALANQIADDH